MENKTLNFLIYRFHLLPLITNDTQKKLFNENIATIDEIRENKNKFFKIILDDLAKSKYNKFPIKLHHHEDNYYLFKLAQKKTTTITKDFKNHQIENEPYVHIIINNNKNIQKIAISDNDEAFSNPDVVKNILKKIFRRDLERYGLNIEIEQLFDSISFWEYVRQHKDSITYIDFEFIKPNLANISKSLPDVFKSFADNVNSHESHLSIKAPERGVLENVDESNKNISGLVEYTSNGAGSIKLKVKNFRKQLNTKENPVIVKVQEIDIEGAAEQVFKVYQSIVRE